MSTNKNNKIIKFQPKQSELLTQSEILKVFSGLVRLVQKSAQYNAEQKVKTQVEYYKQKLNETIIELNKKNNQLKELLEVNEELLMALNNKNNDKLL